MRCLAEPTGNGVIINLMRNQKFIFIYKIVSFGGWPDPPKPAY